MVILQSSQYTKKVSISFLTGKNLLICFSYIDNILVINLLTFHGEFMKLYNSEIMLCEHMISMWYAHCSPPPPQPRHCIWLLADLPDPPLRACTSGTQGHPGPSRAPAVAPWTSTPSWRLRRHSESARPAALRRLEGGSHSLLLLCSQKNRGPGDGVRKGTPPAPGFCF